MRGWFFPMILVLSNLSLAWAQEAADSIHIGGLSAQEIEELTTPMRTSGSAITEPIGSIVLSPSNASDIDLSQLPPPSEEKYNFTPNLHIDLMPKGSYLPYWHNGFIYGSSSQSSSLMYGYVAHSSMGIYQQLGSRWSVNAGVDLAKYSIYYNTATFNGTVTWQANKYMDFTVFGSYMPGSFLSPMPLGPSFSWGGYIDLHTDTDVPFGIDLGASTTYDPLYGHGTTPIVHPYVRLGESKIGFDFGPMIRNAMERANGGKNGNGIGVIPKPIKAVPQIAPRR